SGTAEREAALEMVRSVKRMGLDPGYLLGDGNYTAGAFLSELLELGVEPLVPIQGEIEPLPCWQRRTLDLDRKRKRDRKSTRLNSSHVKISYAVFCLKKKIQPIFSTRTN